MLTGLLMSLYTAQVYFPSTSLGSGVSFFSSPEKWAAGSALLLGVPRFKIKDIEGPFYFDREARVHFVGEATQMQRVTLHGRSEFEGVLTLSNMWDESPHTLVHFHMQSQRQGFQLVLNIDTSIDGDVSGWLEGIQPALEVALGRNRAMDTSVFELERLRDYREFLKNPGPYGQRFSH
jgi:hypothetical protein